MNRDQEEVRTFSELVTSRKAWLGSVLRPWCEQAGYHDLQRAEGDWPNLAGKVDPQKTLWYWAWSRFPELVHAEISDIDETHALEIELKNGQTCTGYPDARESQHGKLAVLVMGKSESDPAERKTLKQFTIDEIAAIRHA